MIKQILTTALQPKTFSDQTYKINKNHSIRDCVSVELAYSLEFCYIEGIMALNRKRNMWLLSEAELAEPNSEPWFLASAGAKTWRDNFAINTNFEYHKITPASKIMTGIARKPSQAFYPVKYSINLTAIDRILVEAAITAYLNKNDHNKV